MSKKLSFDEVKRYIETVSGSGCKLLSEEYINANSKLNIKCICGNYFEKSLSKFKRSENSMCCVTCSRRKSAKKQTMTHTSFISKLPNKIKDEYQIMTEYKRQSEKVKVKHIDCGYIWNVSSSSLIKGHGCPKCSGKLKKTTVDFKKEVRKLTGGEYEVLGEYLTAQQHIKIRHNRCGRDYKVRPVSFIRGNRCPYCAGMYSIKEDFLKLLKLYGNDEYTLNGDYINKITDVKLIHTCGNVFSIKPYSFIGGTRCPKCQHRSYKKTQEEFNCEVENISNGEYSVIGEYIDSKTKVLIKHNHCDHEWFIKPNNFLNGKRCPKCASSNGEKAIESILCNCGVTYNKEFMLKYENKKYPLRVDFKLSKVFIEFDGSQHFTGYKFFGGIEKLKQTQQNDKIKNQYCVDNNIPLIRIPYTQQKNIEYILHNVLIHFGLIENEQDTYDKEIVLKYLVDSNWDHDNYIKENTK